MRPPSIGASDARSITLSRIVSMPRFEAASSSITSSERASWIAMQRSQVPSGVGGRPVLAVQRLGEDLGERGLAGAARAGEQVGMRDAILLDRGLQGAHDMFLAHDVGERAWAVLAIERRHRHRV